MRLERDAALRKTVLGYLAQGWSPEQLSRRLAKEQQHHVISHETIYRFIYAQIRGISSEVETLHGSEIPENKETRPRF